MKTSEFDYTLPKELIAQIPAEPRDLSRLLVYCVGVCPGHALIDDHFYNLDKYLDSNDVLVFNNSKVFPARIRVGGGEIFLLKKADDNIWECLVKQKVIKKYSNKVIDGLSFKFIKKTKNNSWLVKFNLSGEEFDKWLEKNAETPLPPYIKTNDSEDIRQKYQTIYAKQKGSVAAPTAGLHFTKNLLEKTKNKGVQIEFVTLHVGLGTFSPVKTDKVEKHVMHAEYAILDSATADRLNTAKQAGKNIIAVGTTSVRVLESCADKTGKLKPFSGWLNIFIYPGYKFKFVNSLITNFHLPKSSLLMLVSAFLNKDKGWWRSKKHGIKILKKIYSHAIKKKYRFYSFGDGMMIK